MIRKFTIIFAVGVFLIAAVNLLADEKGDEEKAPDLQKELESRQPGELKQAPHPAEAARQPAARRRVRARWDNQVEIDVVERRIRAGRQQPPVRRQVPARLGQVVQLQNRWFNALKEAYREGDMERVGRLIRRMERFRKLMRNRMESAQAGSPLLRSQHTCDHHSELPDTEQDSAQVEILVQCPFLLTDGSLLRTEQDNFQLIFS